MQHVFYSCGCDLCSGSRASFADVFKRTTYLKYLRCSRSPFLRARVRQPVTLIIKTAKLREARHQLVAVMPQLDAGERADRMPSPTSLRPVRRGVHGADVVGDAHGSKFFARVRGHNTLPVGMLVKPPDHGLITGRRKNVASVSTETHRTTTWPSIDASTPPRAGNT